MYTTVFLLSIDIVFLLIIFIQATFIHGLIKNQQKQKENSSIGVWLSTLESHLLKHVGDAEEYMKELNRRINNGI